MSTPDKKPPTDWDTIAALYRAGQISVRAIAAQFAITEGAIRKRAKAEGWERDLSARVQEATRAKMARIDGAAGLGTQDEGTHDGTQKASARTEAAIVEAAARAAVDVRMTHRRDIAQLRAITSTLATRLAAMVNGDPIAPGEAPPVGAKETMADVLEKLARTTTHLVKLERQAFNLDDMPVEAPTEADTAAKIRAAVGALDPEQRAALRKIAETAAGATLQ